MVRLTVYVLIMLLVLPGLVMAAIGLTQQDGSPIALWMHLAIELVFAALVYGNVRERKMARARAARVSSEVAELAGMDALPAVKTQKVLVRAGEVAHFSAPAVLLQNQTVGYSGNSAGVSVRVAKGVTLRSGGMKGHAVKGLTQVASGELALLNTRMIFAGDMKSFEAPYAKITHIEPLGDGMVVHLGNVAYFLQLEDASKAPLLHLVSSRLLSM